MTLDWNRLELACRRNVKRAASCRSYYSAADRGAEYCKTSVCQLLSCLLVFAVQTQLFLIHCTVRRTILAMYLATALNIFHGDVRRQLFPVDELCVPSQKATRGRRRCGT